MQPIEAAGTALGVAAHAREPQTAVTIDPRIIAARGRRCVRLEGHEILHGASLGGEAREHALCDQQVIAVFGNGCIGGAARKLSDDVITTVSGRVMQLASEDVQPAHPRGQGLGRGRPARSFAQLAATGDEALGSA